MTPLLLTAAELIDLTGYRSPAHQLAELQRRGFWRARRSAAGQVVLERAHYEAVCRGDAGTPAAQERPRLRPPTLRPVRA